MKDIRNQYQSLRRRLTAERDRQQLDVAWDRYETAMSITAGPDPNRAEHWQKTAGDRLAALKRVMQSLQNGVDLADSVTAERKRKAG